MEYAQTQTQLQPQRTTFTAASILAIICAIASFFVSWGLGLLLAIVAIVLGGIGFAIAILPRHRGGVLSVLAILAGVIGVIVAIFRLVGHMFR